MDERPPMCIPGLCNVRTCAIFAAICEFAVSVLLLIVALFYTIYVIVTAVMRSVDTYYYIHLLILIVIIVLLAIDIRLRVELFTYEFTRPVIWFRVCVTVFIFSMFILLVINLMGLFLYEEALDENLRRLYRTLLFSCVVFGILLVPYYYPVYQYYKYEKMRNQNFSENQPMYEDATELEMVV